MYDITRKRICTLWKEEDPDRFYLHIVCVCHKALSLRKHTLTAVAYTKVEATYIL